MALKQSKEDKINNSNKIIKVKSTYEVEKRSCRVKLFERIDSNFRNYVESN